MPPVTRGYDAKKKKQKQEEKDEAGKKSRWARRKRQLEKAGYAATLAACG